MAAAREQGGGGSAAMAAHLGQNPVVAGCDDTALLHWSRHLKCQVCFGYLNQPHTLTCGHSFSPLLSRSCLVRLGQTARAANPDIALRYFRLPCPTCRALFPASSVLRGHASTTFLVQNLVSDTSQQLQSSSTVTLRSICTQTASRRHRLRRRKSPTLADQDMHEQFHVRMKLDDFYYRSMTAHSSDSSDDLETSKPPPPPPPQPMELPLEPSVNASETSTVSSVSSHSGPEFMFGRRFEELGHQLAAGHRNDWSPGRVLLMSVWCMYSMVVVGIAQPMLPYMVLITLFFLLIILK